MLAGAVVGVSFGVLLIILIIWLVFRKKEKKKYEEEETPNEIRSVIFLLVLLLVLLLLFFGLTKILKQSTHFCACVCTHACVSVINPSLSSVVLIGFREPSFHTSLLP